MTIYVEILIQLVRPYHLANNNLAFLICFGVKMFRQSDQIMSKETDFGMIASSFLTWMGCHPCNFSQALIGQLYHVT